MTSRPKLPRHKNKHFKFTNVADTQNLSETSAQGLKSVQHPRRTEADFTSELELRNTIVDIMYLTLTIPANLWREGT